MEELIPSLIIIAIVALPIGYSLYRENAYQKRFQRLRPPNTVFAEQARIRISHPSSPTRRWTKAILYVSNKHLMAYATRGSEAPLLSVAGHKIEGFWRPHKYEDGINGIEIHANADQKWTILKARLPKSRMMALVRVLKALVDEDTIRSYRQRRPYVYHPADDAQLAHRDLYGIWDYETPFRVYLTPATLVFLSEDDNVQRVIPVREIQNIRILQPENSGIKGGAVCFAISSTQEEVALMVEDPESWAQSIANAARRTLEDPVTRKRKGKAVEDDEIEWDNAAFDMDVWEAFEYVLGDDGELEPRQPSQAEARLT